MERGAAAMCSVEWSGQDGDNEVSAEAMEFREEPVRKGSGRKHPTPKLAAYRYYQ